MQFLETDRLSSNRVAALLVVCFLVICSTIAYSQEKPPDIPPDPQGAIQEVAPDKAAVPQTPPPNPASEPAHQNPAQNEIKDATKATKPDQPPPQDVKLGAGDLVEVNVYGVPELSTKARVSNDGNLYPPLVDNVHVADLSLAEAQRLVEKRLDDGGFVRNPHVTIFVDEYSSQGVTLLGEVAKPGVYPVLGDRRLFDLISYGGGLSDKAGRTVMITHRTEPDKPETIHLARHLLDDPNSNVYIRPGDTVEVRRAPSSMWLATSGGRVGC